MPRPYADDVILLASSALMQWVSLQSNVTCSDEIALPRQDRNWKTAPAVVPGKWVNASCYHEHWQWENRVEGGQAEASIIWTFYHTIIVKREPEGKTSDFLVSLYSNPYSLPWDVGGDCKNKFTHTSVRRRFPLYGDLTLPKKYDEELRYQEGARWGGPGISVVPH